MTFEHAWVLALLVLPAAWAALTWEPGQRLRLCLKAVMFAAILFALSEPRITLPQTKLAAVILADTSASLTAEDLAHESEFASKVESSRGRYWTRVIPFARSVRSLTQSETKGRLQLQETAGEAGHGTDLEGAVRFAVSSLPSGMVPRVVLLSDGNENSGSMARGAYLARELSIPVDTIPLTGRSRPNLRVEAVSMPSVAFTGEQFPIDVVVSAPRPASGFLELSAEGKLLGKSPVEVLAGSNQLRVHATVNVAGAVAVSGVIRAEGLGEDRFEQAVTLRRPHVLYVSGDPSGTESHLLDTLGAAKFEVSRSADLAHGRLDDYQLVIVNNWDLESIPASRKDEFEKFVKSGGGLLVIGGEKNVYMENKKTEDALDRALPAKLAPPRSPEGTAVVLIIDKSSSMEGRKIELARLAAIGVIENLRPVDLVGVLIFDNSFQWAVPMRRAEDRSLIKRLVSGITPDGGTQIAPALTEAFRKILPTNATYRHIVLLTDGISEEGDSMALSREAAGQRVTISTVGLGQDVNRSYLEKVASAAKGKSYFLTDPAGLEQILLKDVMEHTGSTAVEKPIVPAVVHLTDVLNGIDPSSIPQLKGYVKFISKPTADVVLNLDQKDPLLAEWQYGLGRSAVFTSDAKSRWAEKWVTWNGYDKFWVNLCRDLLPRSQSGETSVSFDNTAGKLAVTYRLAPGVPGPDRIPDIFIFGPDKFQKPVPVVKTAEGTYHGEVITGNRQGLFRIRPLEESAVFPETGIYREEEELRQYGNNEALLKQVAAFTGGRFNPSPEQVFDGGGKRVFTTLELWPGLLGLALVLNLLELFIRKWPAVQQLFAKPVAATA